MKKSLLLSMVIAVVVTAFTGCSKKDVYDPERPEKDAIELYKKNFRAYVGGTINSAVDWGFGASAKARTRADESQVNVVLDPKGYSSEFYLDFFRTVEEYFPENDVCKYKEWYNYEFIQNGPFCNIRLIYTNTTKEDEIGLFYYDFENETYEDAKEIVLIDNLQKVNLGHYYRYNVYKDLDEDWITPKNTHQAYTMWHERVVDDEEVEPCARIQARTWTVYMPGTYHFGIYVRNKDAQGNTHTYYTNQFKNADENAYSGAAIGDKAVGKVEQSYVFGISDDDQQNCNMLFAIVQAGENGKYPLLYKPEKKKEPEWYRIIGEDLNAHDLPADGLDGVEDDTDFDFNDIVLDVALVDGGADCVLQAAGATLPIRINSDNNLEVHKMFGVDQKIMVNTNADKANLPNAKKPPVEFHLSGSFNSIDDITIEVFRQNHWIKLFAVTGSEACKIAVKSLDFVWPDERVSLKTAYPNFLKYVQEPDKYKEWWNSEWK